MRESLPAVGRVVLGAMRFGALLLLFLVLARPVRVERREEVYEAEVMLLLDDSASMQRRDAYGGSEETRDGLAELTGLDPARAQRFELVREALEGGFLGALRSRGYSYRLHGFAEVKTDFSSPGELSGRGHATHLGDAVTRVLADSRGRHVTSMVVLLSLIHI